LAVRAGHGDLAEQVLVHVTLEVFSVVGGEIHHVDALNDGAEGGPVVNFQSGAVEEEFSRGGHSREFMEFLDSRTHCIKEGVTCEGYEILPR
jgi:hypothetical protein